MRDVSLRQFSHIPTEDLGIPRLMLQLTQIEPQRIRQMRQDVLFLKSFRDMASGCSRQLLRLCGSVIEILSELGVSDRKGARKGQQDLKWLLSGWRPSRTRASNYILSSGSTSEKSLALLGKWYSRGEAPRGENHSLRVQRDRYLIQVSCEEGRHSSQHMAQPSVPILAYFHCNLWQR